MRILLLCYFLMIPTAFSADKCIRSLFCRPVANFDRSIEERMGKEIADEINAIPNSSVLKIEFDGDSGLRTREMKFESPLNQIKSACFIEAFCAKQMILQRNEQFGASLELCEDKIQEYINKYPSCGNLY